MIKVKNSQLTNEVISMLNNLMNLDIKAGASFKLMRIIKDLSVIIEDKLKTTFFHRKLNKNVSYKGLIKLEAYKLLACAELER